LSKLCLLFQINGNLEFFRRSFADFNILHELRHNFVDLTVKDIATQMDLEYKPLKVLTLKGSFQYRSANTLREHKIHEFSNQAEAYRADYSQAIIDNNHFLFQNPSLLTANPYSILPEDGFYNTNEADLRHTYFRAPKEWLTGTCIHNVNLSFQATNLWLLYSDSKLNGIDPEFYLSGGVSSPVSRMYTFTVNLTF